MWDRATRSTCKMDLKPLAIRTAPMRSRQNSIVSFSRVNFKRECSPVSAGFSTDFEPGAEKTVRIDDPARAACCSRGETTALDVTLVTLRTDSQGALIRIGRGDISVMDARRVSCEVCYREFGFAGRFLNRVRLCRSAQSADCPMNNSNDEGGLT